MKTHTNTISYSNKLLKPKIVLLTLISLLIMESCSMNKIKTIKNPNLSGLSITPLEVKWDSLLINEEMEFYINEYKNLSPFYKDLFWTVNMTHQNLWKQIKDYNKKNPDNKIKINYDYWYGSIQEMLEKAWGFNFENLTILCNLKYEWIIKKISDKSPRNPEIWNTFYYLLWMKVYEKMSKDTAYNNIIEKYLQEFIAIDDDNKCTGFTNEYTEDIKITSKHKKMHIFAWYFTRYLENKDNTNQNLYNGRNYTSFENMKDFNERMFILCQKIEKKLKIDYNKEQMLVKIKKASEKNNNR